jgi:uncharacterized protein
MTDILAGLIAGFIFGLGLCLSGLADPSVVQGFLDVGGRMESGAPVRHGGGIDCDADWLSPRIRAGPSAVGPTF